MYVGGDEPANRVGFITCKWVLVLPVIDWLAVNSREHSQPDCEEVMEKTASDTFVMNMSKLFYAYGIQEI